METRALRAFVTAVREEGITAAADVLRINQPTLSRQIKSLEQELGTVLFVRGSRSRALELTREGRMFYRRACEILALSDKATAELTISETIAGDLHIAAAEINAMDTVAKALTRLRRRHPGIQVHLQDAYSDDIIDELNNGLADFGLLVQPLDMSAYDYLEMPERDRLGMLVRADHPLANERFITVEQLKDMTVLLPKGSLSRNDVFAQIQRGDNSFQIAGTMNLPHNAVYLVRRGFGNALCCESVLTPYLDDGLAFLPLFPERTIRTSLAWKKNQPLSRPAEAFLEVMRDLLDHPDNIEPAYAI